MLSLCRPRVSVLSRVYRLDAMVAATETSLLAAVPSLTSVYTQHIHPDVPGFPDDLALCTGFQWDAGNADKNWELHQVSQGDCEQVFFNRPLLVAPDLGHSERESRYAALGHTNAARPLAVVFTIRGTLVRVISARDMSRSERRIYEEGQASG